MPKGSRQPFMTQIDENRQRTRKKAKALRDESLFKGAGNRWQDLKHCIEIAGEFYRGFRLFQRLGPCVTVFGSARFTPGHPYYELAQSVGRELGRAGFSVMTGGGPGIMEAANRGAQEVGSLSVGCNILLPVEQKPNPYLDVWTQFDHFYVRKVMLVKFSQAFIVLPGGFGTMDEVFETLTLIQTGKIKRFPLVVVGREYWQEMADFVRDPMLKEGTINSEDTEHVYFCDDPMDAVRYISAQTAG